MQYSNYTMEVFLIHVLLVVLITVNSLLKYLPMSLFHYVNMNSQCVSSFDKVYVLIP